METPEQTLAKYYSFVDELDSVEKEDLLNTINIVFNNAYNQALEDAAKNAEADFKPMGWLSEHHASEPFVEGEDYEVCVLNQSILKLKIE